MAWNALRNQEQESKANFAWRYGVLLGAKMRTSPIRAPPCNGSLRLISFFLMLIALSQSTLAFITAPPRTHAHQTLSSRATNESSLLQCLQVAPPVLKLDGGCEQSLMVHTFAYSYGQPFVGQYNPPNCSFNRVAFNFTVTSAGRQFDRLGLMFFGDTEVFRTSTAEPTREGIIWSYVKDMSGYLALLRTQQKIIFDLGNLIDDTYTGSWNTTLTATFFTAADAIEPADVIVPISARRSADNAPSAFVVPETSAIDRVIFPQNVRKAVFSISACGQAAEEFWWSNVLSSDTRVFGNDTTLYGHSPFRELRLLIDDQLAGVVWPFPVIFTGGIVPGFWRPIVGIDAFDLREDEIDITPFIPLLNDNAYHTFEIQVVGIDDDGHGNSAFTTAIESNWVVTGKVFIWLDPSNSRTAGTLPTISASAPSVRLHSMVTHPIRNDTRSVLEYAIQVSRRIHVESILYTSGRPKPVTWTQDLTFSNSGTLSNKGNDQVMRQSTTGTHSTFSGYSRSFEYPLWVNSSYNAPAGGNVTIDASMGRGKYVQQLDDLAFPNDWKTFDYTRLPSTPYNNRTFLGSDVNNWQNGTASYLSVPTQKRSYGSGNTEQRFSLSGVVAEHPATVVQDGTNAAVPAGAGPLYEELYRRHIVAANDSVVHDESFADQLRGQSRYAAPDQQVSDDGMHEFAQKGVKALLGRGPA